MLDNFVFTLYEIFGYLFPGGLALLGISLLFWAVFVPRLPLGIATCQPGLVTWTAVVFISYLLGHAVQAIGNLILKGAEHDALGVNGTLPEEIRQRAAELSAKLLTVNGEKLNPVWIFRTLDEQSIQTGKAGDRDIFVYREGFYRGGAIALFFLTVALLVRSWLPGSSIQFTKGVFYISQWQFLTTALITAVVGRLFVSRYRRFAEYRISRAVLAALVLQKGNGGP
jgi:hypothetical protein